MKKPRISKSQVEEIKAARKANQNTLDAWFIPVLKELSMVHPVIAMEDESAIFFKDDVISLIGRMYLLGA